MKHIHRNILTTAALAIFGLLLLGGCFRQHIESTPPGATPATRSGTASASPARPAAAPNVVNDSTAATAGTEEPATVIEETYVVDAPKDTAAPAPKIEEDDLAAEPAPAEPVSAPAKAAPVAAPAAKPAPKPIAPEADAAVADVATPDVMGDMFYIQVGSFSELDNANKVLASLIEQGYDGSRLSMTDEGQFRVQAGAFTDKAEARKVLDSLTTKFKGAYILKGTPQ